MKKVLSVSQNVPRVILENIFKQMDTKTLYKMIKNMTDLHKSKSLDELGYPQKESAGKK